MSASQAHRLRLCGQSPILDAASEKSPSAMPPDALMHAPGRRGPGAHHTEPPPTLLLRGRGSAPHGAKSRSHTFALFFSSFLCANSQGDVGPSVIVPRPQGVLSSRFPKRMPILHPDPPLPGPRQPVLFKGARDPSQGAPPSWGAGAIDLSHRPVGDGPAHRWQDDRTGLDRIGQLSSPVSALIWTDRHTP